MRQVVRLFLVVLVLGNFIQVMILHAMQDALYTLGSDRSELESMVRYRHLWGVSDHRFGRHYCGVCEGSYWPGSAPAIRDMAILVGGRIHPACAARGGGALCDAKSLLSMLTSLSPRSDMLAELCASAFLAAWSRAYERQTIADVLGREGGQQAVKQFANGPGAEAIIDKVMEWAEGGPLENVVKRRLIQWWQMVHSNNVPVSVGQLVSGRRRPRDQDETDGRCLKRARITRCRRSITDEGRSVVQLLRPHYRKRNDRDLLALDQQDSCRVKRPTVIDGERFANAHQVTALFRKAMAHVAVGSIAQPTSAEYGIDADACTSVICARKRRCLMVAAP